MAILDKVKEAVKNVIAPKPKLIPVQTTTYQGSELQKKLDSQTPQTSSPQQSTLNKIVQKVTGTQTRVGGVTHNPTPVSPGPTQSITPTPVPGTTQASTVPTTQPVYYSTVKGWTPSNAQNALVVYITKSGRTTGETSQGKGIVPEGVMTNATVYDEGGRTSAGSMIARDVQQQYKQSLIDKETYTNVFNKSYETYLRTGQTPEQAARSAGQWTESIARLEGRNIQVTPELVYGEQPQQPQQLEYPRPVSSYGPALQGSEANEFSRQVTGTRLAYLLGKAYNTPVGQYPTTKVYTRSTIANIGTGMPSEQTVWNPGASLKDVTSSLKDTIGTGVSAGSKFLSGDFAVMTPFGVVNVRELKEKGKSFNVETSYAPSQMYQTSTRLNMGVGMKEPEVQMIKGIDTLGFPVRVASNFLPGTRGEALLYYYGGKIYGAAPKVIKYAIDTAIMYGGGKAALNKDLSIEERTAGGLIAIAGGVSAGSKFFKQEYTFNKVLKKDKTIVPKVDEKLISVRQIDYYGKPGVEEVYVQKGSFKGYPRTADKYGNVITEVVTGSKTIVTKQSDFGKILNFINPKWGEPIQVYGGNPKLQPQAYKDVLKILTKRTGTTNAKNYLRYSKETIPQTEFLTKKTIRTFEDTFRIATETRGKISPVEGTRKFNTKQFTILGEYDPLTVGKYSGLKGQEVVLQGELGKKTLTLKADFYKTYTGVQPTRNENLFKVGSQSYRMSGASKTELETGTILKERYLKTPTKGVTLLQDYPNEFPEILPPKKYGDLGFTVSPDYSVSLTKTKPRTQAEINKDVLNNLRSIVKTAKSIWGKDTSVVVTTPRTTPIKNPSTKIAPDFSKVLNVPSQVLETPQSQYYGTGLYERFSFSELLQPPKTTYTPPSESNLGEDNIFSGLTSDRQVESVNARIDQKLGLQQINVPETKQSTSQSLVQRQVQAPKQLQLPQEKIAQQQKIDQRISPIQKVTPTQKLKPGIFPGFSMKQNINFKFRTKITPNPDEFSSTKLSTLSRSRLKKGKGLFVAEITQRGKFKQVAIGNIQLVTARGVRSVKKELGATLRIKEVRSGRTVKIPFSSPEFRSSKKDPLALVQKQTTRLGTTSERRLLQEARFKI